LSAEKQAESEPLDELTDAFIDCVLRYRKFEDIHRCREETFNRALERYEFKQSRSKELEGNSKKSEGFLSKLRRLAERR